MKFAPNPSFIFQNGKIKFIINEESLSDKWRRKIFFELTPLRSVPRCALLLSVVGAYNSGYEVHPSARGSPKLLPTVATSHIRKRNIKSKYKIYDNIKRVVANSEISFNYYVIDIYSTIRNTFIILTEFLRNLWMDNFHSCRYSFLKRDIFEMTEIFNIFKI